MNPLRWDVLLVAFVLAVPVLALGLRGDFTAEETVSRLPWCLLAAWAAVALLRAGLEARRSAPGDRKRSLREPPRAPRPAASPQGRAGPGRRGKGETHATGDPRRPARTRRAGASSKG